MYDVLVSVNTGFKYGGHANNNTRMYDFVQFFLPTEGGISDGNPARQQQATGSRQQQQKRRIADLRVATWEGCGRAKIVVAMGGEGIWTQI